MIDIVEILPEGLKQGTTRPLLCKVADGRLFVVKNKRTGTRGLIAEYVAARLAQKLSLPVPDFDILGIHPQLASQSVHTDAKGLAMLPSFGSVYVEDAVELTENHLRTARTFPTIFAPAFCSSTGGSRTRIGAVGTNRRNGIPTCYGSLPKTS